MRIAGIRHRLTEAHMTLMRIPSRLWNVSVKGIDDALTRELVANYCKNIHVSLDRGEGFLLWGDNGVGKSSAAVLMAMEARRVGASVFYITAESLRQGVLDKEKFDEESGLTIYDRARSVDFLVLDELGKESGGENSDWMERLLENLLRERSSFLRVTMITTNAPPESLAKRYKHSMLEVIKETVVRVHVVGQNRRDSVQRDVRTRLVGDIKG